MSTLYIGLMSGTSLDGVDGVLADCTGPRPRVLAHADAPLPAALRSELLGLNTSGADELHRAWLAGNALMRVYAGVVARLLADTGVAAADVRAIGAHGQTVRHRPGQFDGTGYTIQLAQPALLAELTGLAVVADFRSRDVAAGGQGAPLAPFFHHAVFGHPEASVGVLNLGGIANLTVLRPGGGQIGFDCGPANALLDAWCERHTGQPFDRDGAWAAGGQVHASLLASLLAEPYFALPPPKSTGRDLFHPAWLQARLDAWPGLAPRDVQATLAELTASACAQAVRSQGAGIGELVVCGGGAFNAHVMRRLADLLAPVQVLGSDARGIAPQQVEAAAFAWLACQCIEGRKLALTSTTGARGARVLGAVYPA